MNVIFDWLLADNDRFESKSIYISGHSQNSMFSQFVGFCHSEKVAGIYMSSGGLTVVDEFKKYWKTREMGLKHVQGFLQTCDGTPYCQYWSAYPCYDSSRPVTTCFGSSDTDPYVWDDSFTHSMNIYGYQAALAEGHPTANLV